jgi:hypothetical protein
MLERSVYDIEDWYISDIKNAYNAADKYTFYDVNEDGVPDLVLQGDRVMILSYDGNLHELYSDRYYSGFSRFVNGGKILSGSIGRSNRSEYHLEGSDGNGNIAGLFSAVLYAVDFDEDADSWQYKAIYYEGEAISYAYTYEGCDVNGLVITEEDFNEIILIMINDDEVEWIEFDPQD